MGIDRSLEFARKFADIETPHGQISMAAVLWLEAQALPVGSPVRESKLEEAEQFLLFARGYGP